MVPPLQNNRSKSLSRYQSAIVGLGQIGNQFDEDPKRTEIWTHAGAYSVIPEVELIAGADSNADRLRRFVEQRGGAKGYRDYREMLQSEAIDLLSICSPTALHHEMVLAGVQAGVRAIFCEKPLASTLEEAAEIVEACESAGIVLTVNHTRRWDPLYIHAKRRIDQGAIGSLESLVGYYPGKVFTMGTHLFDQMRYFAGDVEWVCGDEAGRHEGEPYLSGYLHFRSGVHGLVVSGRDRQNHLFELDLLGSRGRIRISDDGTRMELSQFQESPRYDGYLELAAIPVDAPETVPGMERLVTAVENILRCLRGEDTPRCSGRDGMAALGIALALVESADRGNIRMAIPHPDPRPQGEGRGEGDSLLEREVMTHEPIAHP